MLAAEGGEVDAGDGPVALGQGGGQLPGRRGELAAVRPRVRRRVEGRSGGILLLPGDLLDQDQGWVAVQVGGEQPWRRDVVVGGQPERGHLGGEAGGVLAGADPQHHATQGPRRVG